MDLNQPIHQSNIDSAAHERLDPALAQIFDQYEHDIPPIAELFDDSSCSPASFR